jgi:putative membrane protein
MFLLGTICAAAMILPGVSGSLVLMAFGYYLYVTQQASYFLEKIINFDFTGIIDTILILVSFLIGAIIGIVFISKLLKKLFDKYLRIIYVIILGLLVASPFAIIYTVVEQYNNQIIEASPWSYIVGILFMFIGAFLALLPDFLEKKKINE